jgi:hypothetical protein
MKQHQQSLDVKNLCSRKLWELAASNDISSQELRAIAGELQLRRHYLNELERILPAAQTQH